MNTFMSQNSKWILPVLVMLLVVFAPLVAEMGGISLGVSSWISQVILVLGMVTAGFGAFFNKL